MDVLWGLAPCTNYAFPVLNYWGPKIARGKALASRGNICSNKSLNFTPKPLSASAFRIIHYSEDSAPTLEPDSSMTRNLPISDAPSPNTSSPPTTPSSKMQMQEDQVRFWGENLVDANHFLIFISISQNRLHFTERVYILPTGAGGDGDEHMVELHQVWSPINLINGLKFWWNFIYIFWEFLSAFHNCIAFRARQGANLQFKVKYEN